jgi:hypothetical protein
VKCNLEEFSLEWKDPSSFFFSLCEVLEQDFSSSYPHLYQEDYYCLDWDWGCCYLEDCYSFLLLLSSFDLFRQLDFEKVRNLKSRYFQNPKLLIQEIIRIEIEIEIIEKFNHSEKWDPVVANPLACQKTNR